jgi:hypothetical protein
MISRAHPKIQAFFLHQLIMGAAFRNPAVFQHNNPPGIPRGR